MAVAIGALGAIDLIAVADELPVVDDSSSTTKKATGQQVLDFVEDNLLPNMVEKGDNLLNPVINGAFNVWQRGTSFTGATIPLNSDDTYLMDRWYILSDGNDTIDVTRETSVIPTGGLYACALDVETTNRKFGIAQIIEQKNCVGFIGQTCTLSFKAKVSATTKLDNLKAAIISWSSTADTVTSDIVSAWGVEGTNPTLVANMTYENTPGNLNPTTNYATYSVTGAIDTASTTNIVLFIWSDVTDTTAGDFLYITDVKLEVGSTASAFVPRLFQDELALCSRHYQKSFDYVTAPAQNAGTPGGTLAQSPFTATSRFGVSVSFSPPMFALPTVTTYNPSAANAEARNNTDGADNSGTTASVTQKNMYLNWIPNAANTIADNHIVHWSAQAEL
jgi:hypothetical protein